MVALNRICMVVSGKGGVGKTLTAINISGALSRMGAKVALLDCDISNPNCAEMLGVRDRVVASSSSFTPLDVRGLEFLSMEGISEGRPVAMHGEEYAQILSDMIRSTSWRADIGILDMPATVSDTFLEVVSAFGEMLVGSVIVVQPAHLETARRLASLHAMEGVPILCAVENMSHFKCPGCGSVYEVFGDADIRGFADEFGITIAGSVPLSMEIREMVEKHEPFLTGELARPFEAAAEIVMRAEPLGKGFVERMKERMRGVARDVLINMISLSLEIANTGMEIPRLQSEYGFSGGRTIELDVTDETLRKVKLQAFFRVDSGLLKLVKNPSTVDDEIRVWDRALIWAFLGRRRDTGSKFDLMDAWLSGKLRYYSTEAGTPRALQFLRNVWDRVRETESFSRMIPMLEAVA
jgi:Mrp family chromosome partitioning ATPase